VFAPAAAWRADAGNTAQSTKIPVHTNFERSRDM
jgi:hypothetical protein